MLFTTALLKRSIHDTIGLDYFKPSTLLVHETNSPSGLLAPTISLVHSLLISPIVISNVMKHIWHEIFTGRNEVVAKVMFLQVCVYPQGGGGCLPQCMLGCHTPLGWRTPPEWRTPLGSRLQHTVYERPVRILLECILFVNSFPWQKQWQTKKSYKDHTKTL